jgi:hypothetical protein
LRSNVALVKEELDIWKKLNLEINSDFQIRNWIPLILEFNQLKGAFLAKPG